MIARQVLIGLEEQLAIIETAIRRVDDITPDEPVEPAAAA